MSKKETIAVALLFCFTTMLKIGSVVALYAHKSHYIYHSKVYLAQNSTIENDLLYAADDINTDPQDDLGFKHTVVAHR